MLCATALLACLALVPTTASAQVRVGVAIGGPQVGVEVGGPPVCQWGYYDYAPYACAPYGWYGPGYFYNGIFLGVGPWAYWGYGHGWGGHRFFGGGGGRYAFGPYGRDYHGPAGFHGYGYHGGGFGHGAPGGHGDFHGGGHAGGGFHGGGGHAGGGHGGHR